MSTETEVWRLLALWASYQRRTESYSSRLPGKNPNPKTSATLLRISMEILSPTLNLPRNYDFSSKLGNPWFWFRVIILCPLFLLSGLSFQFFSLCGFLKSDFIDLDVYLSMCCWVLLPFNWFGVNRRCISKFATFLLIWEV